MNRIFYIISLFTMLGSFGIINCIHAQTKKEADKKAYQIYLNLGVVKTLGGGFKGLSGHAPSYGLTYRNLYSRFGATYLRSYWFNFYNDTGSYSVTAHYSQSYLSLNY